MNKWTSADGATILFTYSSLTLLPLPGPSKKANEKLAVNVTEKQMEPKESALLNDLLTNAKEWQRIGGNSPSRFMQILTDHGGAINLARYLLQNPNIWNNFTELYLSGEEIRQKAFELSVEATVLKPEHRVSFNESELDTARQRLAEVNYSPPWDQ